MRFGFRELMFIIVLLAMPAASWWFVFKPNNQRMDEARQEIAERTEKLRQLEQATQRIDDLGKEIEKLSQAIALFEDKLPAEKETEVVLKEVWNLASRHDLKPRSVRTEKPIKSARYTELPLKMVIAGNFDGFYSFLLDLERLSRITRIPDMQLEKLKKGEDGQTEATFTLSIYFEPRDAASNENEA